MLSREVRIVAGALLGAGGVLLLYFAWRRYRARPAILSIRDCAVGMLLGGAIGDAKGIAYDGQKVIVEHGSFDIDLSAPYQRCPPTNAFMPKDFLAGSFTDDTQLSLALARSLVSASGFSMDAVVREHIREYERTTAGWGRTKECVAKLRDGSCTWQNSGFEEGLGNGVVMKIAPLAFWFAHVDATEEYRINAVEQLARLTHRHPACVASAVVHCCALTHLFSPASGCALDTLAQRYQFIAWVASRAEFYEASYPLVHSPYRLSVRLQQFLALAPNEPTDVQILDIAHGGGYNAVDSLAVVYGALLKCGPTFEAVLHTASLGGNTDSNCSMIGSIVGALTGVSALPMPYIDALRMHDVVIQVGQQLAALVERTRPGPSL